MPLFTLALGLLDGFNPCAMWVLLFLLSVLVRLKDRRRMALVAGTFVLVSGAVYYAFMAAWLNVFLAVGCRTRVRIGLAVLALCIGCAQRQGLRRVGPRPLAVDSGVGPAGSGGAHASRAASPCAAGDVAAAWPRWPWW